MTSLLIGRFQPLHEGHSTLVKKLLEEGRNVVIGLRDGPKSNANPYSAEERTAMFQKAFGDKVTVVPLPESDLCCGAAGTYSMNQPEMAAALGRRKVNNLRQTNAQELLTANIGCTLQITRHLQESTGQQIPVRHVIELLAESYAQA